MSGSSGAGTSARMDCGLQTFAGRHKWAMVYERQNQEIRAGLQSGNRDLGTAKATAGSYNSRNSESVSGTISWGRSRRTQ